MAWWLQYLLMIIKGNPYIVTSARFQVTNVKVRMSMIGALCYGVILT